jgi:hypothetical protein
MSDDGPRREVSRRAILAHVKEGFLSRFGIEHNHRALVGIFDPKLPPHVGDGILQATHSIDDDLPN